MLSLFRNFAKSPLGLGVFALIIVAFVITLYEGKSMFGGAGGTGGAIAKVGNVSITEPEALRRTQNAFEAARSEKPDLDLPTFATQGGADQTIDQMINGRTFELFAAMNGLVASRRLVDGSIASIPAFNGPNGQFDRTTFLSILSQRGIPENQLRDDFARDAITKMLLVPVAGGARAPANLVGPYATLLLEARQGQIAAVPSASFAPKTQLTDAELSAFYKSNSARYTVPERRIVKLARFDRSRFDGKVTPTEAEIAAAYKANAAKYAGRETRSFTQIIVPKQSDADVLLTKVRGGAAMADAAKALGLEALTVTTTDKAAFAKLTSDKVAEAAFGTTKSSYAAIAQSPLGYHIVRVDSIAAIAAKSIDSVRGEIVSALSKTKADGALADFIAVVEDDINGGATFDDIIKKHGLTTELTPPITAAGLAPDTAAFKLPDDYLPLLRDAFQAEPGDDPQVASVGNGTAYVIYHMDRVVAAAPKPLAEIRNQVMVDATVERANVAAKRVADAIVAAINKGMPFAQALAGTGVSLPTPKSAGARRIDVLQLGEKAPEAVRALFSISEKRAKLLPVPQGAGWFVVYLDKITPGDAGQAAPLMAATQQQLTRVIGDEYVQQFASAIKAKVGVNRNADAMAAFKRSLAGGNAR